MARSSLRRKMLALKLGIFGAPLLGLFVLLRCVLPALKEQYDLARYGSESVQIERSHFRLFAKLDEVYAHELADGLEAFYRAFLERHAGQFELALGDEKALVYAFTSKAELEKWSRREFHDPLTNNGGFYSPGQREIGIVARGRDLEEDLASGYHEAVHMAFDVGAGTGAPTRLSPWMSEGLAVYFGDGVVRGPEGFVWGTVPAGQPAELVAAVAQELSANETSALLARVVGASGKDFTSQGNTFFYAASYLLVHFLLHSEDGVLRGRFLEFYRTERERGPQDRRPQVFFQTIGVDAAELEKEWRRHVRRLHKERNGG